MSRPQQVSLARLLRVHESKASTSTSSALHVGVDPDARLGRVSPTSSDAPDDDWRARAPKAHQHVEAMRGLLVQVRAQDPAAADAYAARVDRVEASLRPHRRPDTAWDPPPRRSGARTSPGGLRHPETTQTSGRGFEPGTSRSRRGRQTHRGRSGCPPATARPAGGPDGRDGRPRRLHTRKRYGDGTLLASIQAGNSTKPRPTWRRTCAG